MGGNQHGINAVEVEHLVVAAGFGETQQVLLQDVSLAIPEGKVTCIVGESGSGKTVLIKSLLGVLSARPGPVAGSVKATTRSGTRVDLLEGLAAAVEQDGQGGVRVADRWYAAWRDRLRPFLGAQWGFVAQHGARALDPTRPVGHSLLEALERKHDGRRSRQALIPEACRWLERLHFQQPEQVLALFPAQLSGGMAQRLVIAVALARGARLLFADEPTTGLDPEAQDALFHTISALRAVGLLETLVLVTHDMELAGRIADVVAVMHHGRIEEVMRSVAFFGSAGPRSPQGRHLLDEFRRLSVRRDDRNRPVGEQGVPRLSVRGLQKHYEHRRRWWEQKQCKEVLAHIDLDVYPGEIVGLVGPSGSGKTTLARLVGRLTLPDKGVVRIGSRNLASLSGEALRRERRNFQVLFQQVTAAIHPRMRVEEALRETAVHVMGLHGAEADEAVERALDQFKLTHCRMRLPGRLSGGECRRVGLARALMVQPVLLVADEPTAGIDASLRATLLDLLVNLVRKPSGPAILLISHDRRVMNSVADRVLRLDHGRLVDVHSDGFMASASTGDRKSACQADRVQRGHG